MRRIFDHYNNDGWGYKKIANLLTAQGIPTPRMSEQMRREAAGEETHRAAKSAWAIVTVQGILDNDFYIGTFRQGKTTRVKINGKDVRAGRGASRSSLKTTTSPSSTTAPLPPRARCANSAPRSNYRGVKKYDNVYSGFLSLRGLRQPHVRHEPQRPDARLHLRHLSPPGDGRAAPATTSASDRLDELLKIYIRRVMETLGLHARAAQRRPCRASRKTSPRPNNPPTTWPRC